MGQEGQASAEASEVISLPPSSMGGSVEGTPRPVHAVLHGHDHKDELRSSLLETDEPRADLSTIDTRQPEVGSSRVSLPRHPVPVMQAPFEESIVESADDGQPQYERVNADVRRKQILELKQIQVTFSYAWRQQRNSKFHPLWKLIAQIAFGLYLLNGRTAKSEDEVLTILQNHIDDVDNFLGEAEADLEVAIKDIAERIGFLSLPFEHNREFNKMLCDRNYRTSTLEGNLVIERIIDRTAQSMNATLTDLNEGADAVSELGRFLRTIKSGGSPNQSDIPVAEVVQAMNGNLEGWKRCFHTLEKKAITLDDLILRLQGILDEIYKRAGIASRRKTPTGVIGRKSVSIKESDGRLYTTAPESRRTKVLNKPLPTPPGQRGSMITASPKLASTTTARGISQAPYTDPLPLRERRPDYDASTRMRESSQYNPRRRPRPLNDESLARAATIDKSSAMSSPALSYRKLPTDDSDKHSEEISITLVPSAPTSLPTSPQYPSLTVASSPKDGRDTARDAVSPAAWLSSGTIKRPPQLTKFSDKIVLDEALRVSDEAPTPVAAMQPQVPNRQSQYQPEVIPQAEHYQIPQHDPHCAHYHPEPTAWNAGYGLGLDGTADVYYTMPGPTPAAFGRRFSGSHVFELEGSSPSLGPVEAPGDYKFSRELSRKRPGSARPCSHCGQPGVLHSHAPELPKLPKIPKILLEGEDNVSFQASEVSADHERLAKIQEVPEDSTSSRYYSSNNKGDGVLHSMDTTWKDSSSTQSFARPPEYTSVHSSDVQVTTDSGRNSLEVKERRPATAISAMPRTAASKVVRWDNLRMSQASITALPRMPPPDSPKPSLGDEKKRSLLKKPSLGTVRGFFSRRESRKSMAPLPSSLRGQVVQGYA